MTGKTDPKPEILRKLDSRYGEILLDRFYSSGDPEHLAQYVEDGGMLTNVLRDFVAKLIRDNLPKLRNKSNPLRDLAVYDQVEAWLKSQINAPIYDHIKKNNLTPIESLSAFSEVEKNECPTLQEAYRHFTDSDDSIELETFQKQYERGRKRVKWRI